MKEKTVKNPVERGEYLLSEDVRDEVLANGDDQADAVVQRPCVCVYFRKDGAEEWEPWKTVPSWEEAETLVEKEIAEAKEARKA